MRRSVGRHAPHFALSAGRQNAFSDIWYLLPFVMFGLARRNTTSLARDERRPPSPYASFSARSSLQASSLLFLLVWWAYTARTLTEHES